MANNDLERFDFDSGLPIFMCRQCLTHFARPQREFRTDLIEREILIPEPYINLDIRPQEHHYLDGTITALAYCRGCKTEMGYKIICEGDPNNAALEGMVALKMTLLQFWNGQDVFSFMVHVPMPQPPLLPLHLHVPPFFLCIVCNTHVAWEQGVYGIDMVSSRIFFSESIESVAEPPGRHFLHPNGTTLLAYVKCGGCNEVLGMKMIREEDPSYGFRVGKVGLDMTLLKIWDGIGHEVFSLMKRVPMLMYPLMSEHSPPPPPPPPPPSPSPTPLPPPPMDT